MLKFVFTFILLAVSTFSWAQHFTFQKYGVSQGLSSNTVFSTIEDKYGFIWISTEEGVDRFDGLKFKHYTLPNLYKYRTSNYVEYRLKIDSNNQIWLVTMGGLLYKYDSKKDEFMLFHKFEEKTDQAVHTFFIDHDDKLWFGMYDGVRVLDPLTGNFNRIQSVAYLTSAITQDDNHKYYLGGDNGIVVLDSNQEFLYDLLEVSSSKNTGLKNSRINSLFIDKENDRLWIGSKKLGLCAFNLINFDFSKPESLSSYKGLYIKSIEKFSEREIIVGIDGEGLLFWDLNNERINQLISDDETGPNALSSKSVQQIFKNSSGALFISTWHGGLNVYSPGKLNFQSVENLPHDKNSLRNNVVMMLEEMSPGVIAFGTDKGLSIWDKEKDIWHQVDIDLKKGKHMSNSRAITVDNEHNIWSTSYTDSLVLFKKGKRQGYNSTKDFNPDLSTYNFINVYAGLNDMVWFSDDDNKKIYYYSKISQNVGHYPFTVGNVQAMLSITAKQLAVGTSTGLILVDTDNGKIDDRNVVNNSILKTTMISSLAMDSNKQLWVGTRYEGLFVINFFKNTLTKLALKDGLLSNRIFALAADDDHVWASTSKGISRIDSKNSITNFTESDGLISVDFNYNAAIRDSNGQMYFGTNDGVITFNPDEIKPVKSNKSLAFSEFYLNHKRVLSDDESPLKEPLNDTDLIELKHNQNSFSIGFTSIDFLHSDQGNFQWKLENFDQDWVSDPGTSIASYTNLYPGDYIFRLRIIDQKGELIAPEKNVKMIIRSPFWLTPWAFLFYFIALLLFIAMLIYTNGLRIQSKHSREKLHYLVNIAHEIKTPLMLIKAPLTDLLNNNRIESSMQQGINIALKNAEKVHMQMIQFLDFRHFKLRKKAIILDSMDLIRFIKDKIFVYKVLADKKNIELSLDTNSSELIINTDEKILDKIVGNLLSNAIKYTMNNGKICVKLLVTDRKCKILIKDTGIGVPPSQKKKIFRLFHRSFNAQESGSLGTGVGLVLASDLAKLVGGKVALEESSSNGSVFSFTFPYERTTKMNSDVQVMDSVVDLKVEEGTIGPKIKVLLVEDDEDLLNFSKSKLNNKYHVLTASNGNSALKIVKNSLPDIVISDVMMPKISGLQLCMKLKRNIETCHVPVVLLTGLGSKEHIMQGLEIGADDYIVKPYDYELLESKIEGLLQNRMVLKRKFLIHNEREGEIKFSNKLDDNFMKELTQLVEDNISDTNFSIKDLCEAMGMSRTSFYHKLKSLIDVSPNEFVRTIRLKKGRSMLLKYNYNVSEVAYSVGFSDAKYFGTLFKKYYGQSPSTFVAEKKLNLKPKSNLA